MPPPFSITTPVQVAPTSLDPEHGTTTGTATFLIHNDSDHDDRAMVEVLPVEHGGDGRPAPPDDWFQLDKPVVGLAAGSADQVRVDITAPPGAGAGSYGFRLRAYSASGVPEDTVVTSPLVTFAVEDGGGGGGIPRWVWLAAAAAAAVVVVGVVALLLWRGGDDGVSVPELVGRSRPEAEELLATADLAGAPTEEAVEDPTQDGIVVSQDPEAGAEVEVGGTVQYGFGVLTETALPAPTIVRPEADEAVGPSDTLGVFWQQVDGAVAYVVSLGECRPLEAQLEQQAELRQQLQRELGGRIEVPAGGVLEEETGLGPQGPDVRPVALAQPTAEEGLIQFRCFNTRALRSATTDRQFVDFPLGGFDLSDGDQLRVSVRALDADGEEGLAATRLVEVG